MTEVRHFARMLRAGLYSAVCVLLVASLGGCRHRRVVATLPHGVLAPVPLETPAPPENAPVIAEIPPPVLEPLPLPIKPVKPVPRRRPSAREESPASAQTASETDLPLTLAIGALTAGNDDAGSGQHRVQDLIETIKKRIAALPAKFVSAHKKEVRQVQNYIDQAQKALKSGDTDGATNLATKANLLVDDLEKK